MSWIAEVRYAFRAMSRSRGFTAVAALTLALSIGANTAIFSLADAIVNRPFAFPHLDRMVELTATLPKSGGERYAVTPADYFDWVEQNRVFSQLAAYAPWSARLTGADEPRDVRAYRVSPEFFAVAGIAALRGASSMPTRGRNPRALSSATVSGSSTWRRIRRSPASRSI